MHISKLDNNKVGKNINPKSNIPPPPPNNRLMHICDENNIKCPPEGLVLCLHIYVTFYSFYETIKLKKNIFRPPIGFLTKVLQFGGHY